MQRFNDLPLPTSSWVHCYSRASALFFSNCADEEGPVSPHIQGVCWLAARSLKVGYRRYEQQGLELTDTGSYLLRTDAVIWCTWRCLYPTAWEVKIATFLNRILPREAPFQKRSFGSKNSKHFLAFILLTGEKFLKNSFAPKRIGDPFYSTWIK